MVALASAAAPPHPPGPDSCFACMGASDPLACHRVAVTLAARQDYDRAIAIEEQVRDLRPRNPEVASALARMYYAGHQDAARAIALYHEALHDVSGYPPALLGLGTIMDERGEVEIASRYYARAARENPDVAVFKVRLADTLMRSGREAEARPLLSEIVDRWPGSQEADAARKLMAHTALAKP
ncbi:MAG TPA: tetratricopeptide repeat protein, partial [Candidatus Polarisedimenticolia bacterium]|nr:tetratricopeptide repeat protein [Candidatus Polarisedimenticolia bacterium]